MPQKVIPIRFVDQYGKPALPSDDVRQAVPVMDVSVCSPEFIGGMHAAPSIALVDTGADLNFAKQSLVAARTLRDNFKSVTESSHGAMPTTVYHGKLFFPAVGLLINTDITADVLFNRPYDVIIGRLTLRLGCLLMDYPNNIFEWRVNS